MSIDKDDSHKHIPGCKWRHADMLTRGQGRGAVQQQRAALAVDAAAQQQQPVPVLLTTRPFWTPTAGPLKHVWCVSTW